MNTDWTTSGLHTSIKDAYEAFDAAMKDTAADQGEEAAEAAAHDLIHSVADDCSPEIRREWLRTQLGEPDDAFDSLRWPTPEKVKEQARRNRERAKDRRIAWN